ncbi:hypothetical protein BN8_06374 [Fibrisoma limi BUZ 3]|uniref:Uncharacterized protein n=1 Tax=Fibrisoma limi BUZ 3 TaxID=1185876 RepID=I2GSV2_9BACT|nr:hypothetical protein BN8_06374 [Fibrisoma limi BUZ 3]
MNGASIHQSEAVKSFLKERSGRVHLKRLPVYSPDSTADAVESGLN